MTPSFSSMGGSGITAVDSKPGFHNADSMSDDGEGERPFWVLTAHQ